MKNWIIVLLIFILPLSLYAYLDNRASADACKAPEEATAHKAKLIKFSSPMCSECIEITTEVKKAHENYKDSVIIEEYNVLENNRRGKNATKEMIKKYKVTLVPTLVFVDKEGNVVKKQEGMMKSDKIAKILDEIK